jgi:hypothetical protein
MFIYLYKDIDLCLMEVLMDLMGLSLSLSIVFSKRASENTTAPPG